MVDGTRMKLSAPDADHARDGAFLEHADDPILAPGDADTAADRAGWRRTAPAPGRRRAARRRRAGARRRCESMRPYSISMSEASRNSGRDPWQRQRARCACPRYQARGNPAPGTPSRPSGPSGSSRMARASSPVDVGAREELAEILSRGQRLDRELGDEHGVRPHALDLPGDRGVEAADQAGDADHHGDADDDAEHGERRAHLVGAQALPRHAHDLAGQASTNAHRVGRPRSPGR